MLRHHRIALISCALLLATLLTSLQVRQKTSLLLEANAAPTNPTTPVERSLEAEPHSTADAPHNEPDSSALPSTAGPEVPAPPPPRAALIDKERFFYEPDF